MTKINRTGYRSALPTIKPVYLLAAAGISCIVCIQGLKSNNLTMVHLRSDVYSADKNNGDVRGSLTKLQHYVTSHMNTDLTSGQNAVYPPIQLKYTYERLQAENAKQRSNEEIYADAQVRCEQLNPNDFSGKNRIPCIQEYVATHAAGPAKAIPDSLYKFDFVSPSWSPDLAGWSAFTTFALLLSAGMLWLVRRFKRNA